MATRIAVDAMGGDYAPGAIVRGAVQALADDDGIELVLVGDERRIRAELSSINLNGADARIRVVHASQVIAMDAPPVGTVRTHKDSSVVRMTELAVAGEADAVVSAGNTGACAAVCQLKMKPIPGVTRPGIAVTIPSFHGPFVLCDVGANIQAKPRHLYEYAVMATLYAELVLGVQSPRVALMSIGEESGKGTGLVKRTHELLKGDPALNFVGNVEGRELFEDRCDVAICDGFVGNIVLKFVEGLAEGLFQTIAHEFEDERPELRDKFDDVLGHVRDRHDFRQYGGAPLLGVAGVCIICHGRSNEFALGNAVKAAGRFVDNGFTDAVRARLS